jgi:hypothetical protein
MRNKIGQNVLLMPAVHEMFNPPENWFLDNADAISSIVRRWPSFRLVVKIGF